MIEYRDFLKKTEENAGLYRKFGFKWGDKGAHTSRTMMLSELRALMDVAPENADRDDYETAVLEKNCCSKSTIATRRATLQRLSEIYGLKPSIPLFRIFSAFWRRTDNEQSLLALLLALARDPLLRATAGPVLDLKNSEELSRSRMAQALGKITEGRLNQNIAEKVIRNAGASWTQSGHLQGRVLKTRCLVDAGPVAVAYALLLGFLSGYRSTELLSSPWVLALDCEPGAAERLAFDAARREIIDVESGGGLFNIHFHRLFTEEERRLLNEPG